MHLLLLSNTTPNSTQNTGLFEKKFHNGVDAEVYLQNLHQMTSKA